MSQENPNPSREEAEAALNSDDPEAVCNMLIALSLDPDGDWIREHCVRLAQHENVQIRRVASICLGYAFPPT